METQLPTVNLLVPGYSKRVGIGIIDACSNIILVRDGENNVIIDPGSVKDFQVIVDALTLHRLDINAISAVCVTHYHTDHSKYIGSFPRARIIDRETQNVGSRHIALMNGRISENITMVKTPGHTPDSVTFFVKNTRLGVVAICGDVFCKENDFGPDSSHSNPRQNKKSGEIILNGANYIVPGHSRMFIGQKAA